MTRCLSLSTSLGIIFFVAFAAIMTTAKGTTSVQAQEGPSLSMQASHRPTETLTVLYWQAPIIPSPYLSGGTKSRDAAALVLEPLASLNENAELIPRLAAFIPTIENGHYSPEQQVVTWTLKSGLVWSDSTPVTTADIATTWLYCTTIETGCIHREKMLNVDEIEIVDELRIRFQLNESTGSPYIAFVGAAMPVLQKAQFEPCIGAIAQTCNSANTKPVGTGPYTIDEVRVNDNVVYSRNPLYRGPEPYFSTVVLQSGGSPELAARAVLEEQSADYAWNVRVAPDLLSDLESLQFGEVIKAPTAFVERLLMNQTNPSAELDGDRRSVYEPDGTNQHPFLTDPELVRALSLAIDRSAIAELYGEAGTPTCNLIPAPAYYASPNNEGCLAQNIDEANAILDGLGWVDHDGDGLRDKEGVALRLRYQTSTNSVRQLTQQMIQSDWSEIGVEAELIDHGAGIFFGGDPNSPNTHVKFYADVQMYSLGLQLDDPSTYLKRRICSEMPLPENNWTGTNIPRWCSDEYNNLFDMLNQTDEPSERAALVVQMNDLLVQSSAEIPLIQRAEVSARHRTLLGVRMNAWDSELWNIHEWYRWEPTEHLYIPAR